MFSAAGTQPVTFTPSPSDAIARMAPITAAAPDMSAFISSMLAAGLMEMPPVSKVMPLPTRATCEVAPRGAYVMRTRRGGRDEPLPTPKIPPQLSFSRAFSSQTFTVTGRPATESFAAWARSAGARAFGGVLTRSRVKHTASPTVSALSMSSRAAPAGAGTRIATVRTGRAVAGSLDLNAVNA